MIKLPRRRRSREVEWQAQLKQARAPAPPAREPRLTIAELRAQRRRARAAEFAAWGLMAGAGAALTAYGHHRTTLWAILVALFFTAMALHGAAGIRRDRVWKRVEQQERALDESVGMRLDRRLEMISADLNWFLANPPQRTRYEHWLERTAGQIDSVSHEAAVRWTQPDLRQAPTSETVTAAELDARRERLLELRATLGGLCRVGRPNPPSVKA